MNSIDIYNPTNLSTFIVSADYSIDQLQEYYTAAENYGNSAKVAQCCICAKIQDTLYQQHNGKIKTKAYKLDLDTAISKMDIKRKSYIKYAQIGRYVIGRIQENDYSILEDSLSKIQSKCLSSKETKPKQVKVKPDSAEIESLRKELEYYKNEYDISEARRNALKLIKNNAEECNYEWDRYCAKLGIDPYSLKL